MSVPRLFHGEGQGHSTQLQGQAGVWAVASQLALRGFNPLFPGVDYGYDLKLENGIRIQVKAANLRYSHKCYPDGAYVFKWTQYNYHSPSKRMATTREYAEAADFFVCWGIDENRFWIFPCTKEQRALWIPSAKMAPIVEFEEVRRLKDEGLSHQEIATRLSSSPRTVRRVLANGTSNWNSEGSTRKIYSLEGKWDQLDVNGNLRKLETIDGREVIKVL